MASFEIASKKLHQAEGGYSKDTTDSGNYLTESDFKAKTNFIGTNWGISAPILAEVRGKKITQDDMKSLSYEEALQIYKKKYWDKRINGDLILNQSMAMLLYDGMVLQDWGTMVKPNRALKYAYYMATDGEQLTAESVNNLKNPQEIFIKIQKERIALLNPKNPHYENWVKRINGYSYKPNTESTKSDSASSKSYSTTPAKAAGGQKCEVGATDLQKEQSKKCHFKSITLIFGDEEDKR